MTFLVYIIYHNFSRIYIEKILLQVLILFQENMLTAVKDRMQSYWDKVYSRSSFNQMWILNYWIFWIILIIVLFEKFSLSKHVTFLHFTNHASWECIKTFKISLITLLSLKWQETLQIYSNRTWINLFCQAWKMTKYATPTIYSYWPFDIFKLFLPLSWSSVSMTYL
jgi:hypothetical protein